MKGLETCQNDKIFFDRGKLLITYSFILEQKSFCGSCRTYFKRFGFNLILLIELELN